MTELNLITNGREQERILAYLKENVSEILADKINNGVLIEKNGKKLLNKKNLDGFMRYACEEARKQCEKTAKSACIDDPIVFGWAIHYFEEDSIEGTLFNEDGTEYKPVVAKPKTQQTIQPQVVKKQNNQASIFDLMDEDKTAIEQVKDTNIEEDDEDDYPQPTAEEVQEILAELEKEDKQSKSTPQFVQSYILYFDLQNQYPTDIIAYKLGDFYEVIGDNAVILADELSLTLTSRDCGVEGRMPLIGFPYHAADNYFNRICKNHALVIAEDKNNIRRLPKQLLDTETGEITDDIPQPNTHIDKQLLDKLSDILGDIFIVR